MVRSQKQLVWVLAAWAAIAGQSAPKAVCQVCDQTCCGGQTSDHAPKTADSGAAPARHCPLCAPAADLRLGEPTEQPCHCQLDARHEEPLSLSRGGLPAFPDGDPASLGLSAIPWVAPQVLGVSREYVAASLAVPIRPARILFGVWRN